jgi:V-type H+-transporting ATPase subunit D
LDREEFYRLKKVAGKKQRDTAAADAEMKAKKQAQRDQENVTPEEDDAPADILASTEDDDVIF